MCYRKIDKHIRLIKYVLVHEKTDIENKEALTLSPHVLQNPKTAHS